LVSKSNLNNPSVQKLRKQVLMPLIKELKAENILWVNISTDYGHWTLPIGITTIPISAIGYI